MKSFFLPFVFLLLLHPGLSAQTDSLQPRVSDYIKEIEKIDDHNQKIALVFWMPWQYWQTALTQDGAKMSSSSQDLINTLKNYTLVCVVEGNVTPFGIHYKAEQDIRDSILLTINDSVSYRPLAEKDMNEDVQMLLSTVEPLLKSMLGQMGEHLCFYVFKNEGKNAKKLIDAQKAGKFKVSWKAGNTFEWRLPLDVLTPPKYCPVDGEVESGKYIYCPYHGVKLNSSKK